MILTLKTLHDRLNALLRDGVPPNAPIIIEGWTANDQFIQAHVDCADWQSRCEGDDEPPGVYLDLVDAEISD